MKCVCDEKQIEYLKAAGKDNPADLYTKYLSGDDVNEHAAFMHIEFKKGSDNIALTFNEVGVGIEAYESAEMMNSSPCW